MARTHARLARRRTAALALLAPMIAVGCSAEPAAPAVCDPPDEAVYECTTLPAGSEGCTEPPPGFCATGTAPPVPCAGASIPGPGEVVPEGCHVTLPHCHRYFPNLVETAFCARSTVDGGEHAFVWVGPL